MKPAIPGRLHAQGLTEPRFATAPDVVRHLCCVQSQLHDMGLWAVARRTTGLTLADLQGSFDRGDVLRTHVLRPTWHLVAPEDLPWLQALTAPRVGRLMASVATDPPITAADLDVASDVIVSALADGPRTRAELADRLGEAGSPHTRGTALAHVVMHAEITARIANGPMRGKQHTYRLLPPGPSLPDRDTLLAEVARRYGRGHGPFRDKDLAWWTSLTLTDSRRAIELAGLRPVQTADGTHWTDEEELVTIEPPAVMLLSNFDEYISYARDPHDLDAFAGTVDDILRGTGLLLVDGRLAGRWSRTVGARRVRIEVHGAPRVTARLRRGLEAEAAAFARFLDREPELVVPG